MGEAREPGEALRGIGRRLAIGANAPGVPRTVIHTAGLAVSTVFTLILTPVLFSFGYGITERLRALAVRMGILILPEEADAAQATRV